MSSRLPDEEREITIAAPEGISARADLLVRGQLPGLSRRHVRELFEAGRVRINGRYARKGNIVGAGDTLTVDVSEAERNVRPLPDANLAIDILFEDPDLVALDKPAGMPTLPLRVGELGTVANFLATRYPYSPTVGRAFESGLVHRLDTGTSGVILAARNARAYGRLRDQFKRGEIGKSYLALVYGDLHTSCRIDAPIAHATQDPRRMETHSSKEGAARSRARPAVTIVHPVKRFGSVTLVAVRIRTGVRHQVRVHLASFGHPIVSDDLYASATFEPQNHAARWTNRPLLHARCLRFTHPNDGSRVRIVAPLPADLRAILTRAGESSSAGSNS